MKKRSYQGPWPACRTTFPEPSLCGAGDRAGKSPCRNTEDTAVAQWDAIVLHALLALDQSAVAARQGSDHHRRPRSRRRRQEVVQGRVRHHLDHSAEEKAPAPTERRLNRSCFRCEEQKLKGPTRARKSAAQRLATLTGLSKRCPGNWMESRAFVSTVIVSSL